MSAKPRISLTEQAYSAIREWVLVGVLAPGTDISEPDLAERLQMSRTPVREALGRLCIEGYIEAFPRRGYRIVPVTVKDVNDLFTVRGALEGTAAEIAARTLSEDELDALARLADTRYTLGEDASTKSFVSSNADFHAAIAMGTRNPRLYALVISHLEACSRLFYMGTRIRNINPETSDDHRAIVAALRDRNGEKARQAMLAHNEHTHRGILSALINEGQAGVTLSGGLRDELVKD